MIQKTNPNILFLLVDGLRENYFYEKNKIAKMTVITKTDRLLY